MTSITVTLTSAQRNFLKLFAENHHPGAVDNLMTDIPIHVVQSREAEYIPVDENYAEDEPERVTFTSALFNGDVRFKTPGELVRAYYNSESCPVGIVEYTDAKNKTITGTDGAEHYIFSFSSYFAAYGIETYGIDYVRKYWSDVAFFFILKEAKRYMEYQKHNLTEPRVYSFSPGYSNAGEYRHFYELLRSMGNILLEERDGQLESTALNVTRTDT